MNETFTAALNDMEVAFVLTEAGTAADEDAESDARNRSRCCSAIPRRSCSRKQIYALRHPRIGEAGIFLVPVAQEQAGFLYQAVFQRSALLPGMDSWPAGLRRFPDVAQSQTRSGVHGAQRID